jgi:hypothetical protein
MLPIFVGIVARCAIIVGIAFLLTRTVPRNKVWRFVFLFVLCVLLNLVVNYVDVLLLGYHKDGLDWAIHYFFACCHLWNFLATANAQL